jgi:hypothetical protein
MAAFVATTNPRPDLVVGNGPKSVVLVAPGTYTATAQQEFAVHGQGSALAITIHTPAGSAGTESTVPTVEYFDVASQTWVVLLTGVAIVTAGVLDTILIVGPLSPNVANVSQNAVLYERMRINMTHGNANSHLYSISATLY